MGKVIRRVFKIDTLSLHECTDGYWMYDYIRGMNLSMRAKTEQDAYIETILYYQKRLEKVESSYKELSDKVENFARQFIHNQDQ